MSPSEGKTGYFVYGAKTMKILIESPQTTAGTPQDREFCEVERGDLEESMKNGTADNAGKCQFPKCRRTGEECTINGENDSSEADVVLCEHHFAECRSVGQ